MCSLWHLGDFREDLTKTGAGNKPLQTEPHFNKLLRDFFNNQQTANAYYLKIQLLL